jgi:putative transposase
MEITKTLTLRLLFTEEQSSQAKQHADARRACYNWALAESMKEYESTGKRPTQAELSKRLTALKNTEDAPWWTGVARVVLTAAITDLDKAYQKFFKVQKEGVKFTDKVKRKAARQKRKLTPYDMKGHPKFRKRENDRLSFYACNVDRINIRGSTLCILKVGRIPFKCSQVIPENSKISNPRVKYINGKWVLRLGITFQQQLPELNDCSMGIDVGIKSLAVVSCGEKDLTYKHVNKEKRVRRLEWRIRHTQRELCRRVKGSVRYEKTRKRLNNYHFHLSQIRLDRIHKVTREIINLKPKRIVLETLNIAGMMKNKHLAKSIQSSMLYEIHRQLEYKAKWFGIKIERVPQFYPSSKTCSGCGGYVEQDSKLRDQLTTAVESLIKLNENAEQYYDDMIRILRKRRRLSDSVYG